MTALPPTLPALLLDWYRLRARELPWRGDPTPYQVWVSEIMLQQTRVEAAKPYFLRFIQTLPDIPALATCPEDVLLKLWEGLGYYSRARNLQKAAQVVMERHGGALPASYKALLALPGIGSYTAGAIASIAFHLPYPAVDGNVLRVLSRLTASRWNIADPKVKREMEEAIRAILPKEVGDFNQALMELGACVCLPNGEPFCGDCPLETLCEAKAQGIQQDLPVKAPKKPRPVQELTILLLVHEDTGKIALRRRPKKGLLAGMWEPVNLSGRIEQEELSAALKKLGLSLHSATELPAARHIFTHLEWRMDGWRCLVTGEGESEEKTGIIWAAPDELAAQYPLPTAFRWIKEHLEEKGPSLSL